VRILILGGDGMLGHQLVRHFRGRHEIKVTMRLGPNAYAHYELLDQSITSYGIDAKQLDTWSKIIKNFRPDAVVNAIGIVKQRSDAKESIPSLEINALLPHRLAQVCATVGARLVHMSTDCVFSGRKGYYSEADVPDAEDLYGRSKLLGEVVEPHCITFRTSIIGPELCRKTGLLEWLLTQRGQTIKGYTKAIFSGFTTRELARIIERVLLERPHMHGLYHVASTPINKYELLSLIRDRLHLPITIEEDSSFVCNRSLDASRFNRDAGYSPPTWKAMIDDMAQHMMDTAS
jgi:dTDP-4-dehydrorhamnose reductase